MHHDLPITHMPLMIVQGGHDVAASPESATCVHRASKGSVLHSVSGAGHSPAEPGIRSKVIQALEQVKRLKQFDAGLLQASGPV